MIKDKKRFRYMYYAAYRGMKPIDSFFKDIYSYFNYDDQEKCISEGSEWYRGNAHDDYLAFFEYDTKYNTITEFSKWNTDVTLHYIDGSWYNTKRESLEELKELLNKGLNSKMKKQKNFKLKYMYHVTEYTKDAPVNTFFENHDTFFKYDNMEYCIRWGNVQYEKNPDYGYLTFFVYDTEHKCITQIYPTINSARLYLINAESFSSSKDKIEELKELFIQEGKV